jgi:phage terminase large subunit-like protein
MFVPGTQYGIEKCPKHYAFFEATKTYKQTMFRAGNRVGKTQAGAFAITVWTVQDYPEWWPGKVFRGPVTTWACGKTVQVTRETVQKALLGPLNSPGTGTIPQERIKKIWGRAGNPGAVDTIEIMNDWGDVSLIGFKSYDQKLESFVGVALHAGWLDEEADRLVSNEILWRTATTDGVLINTVTPLNGLTEYIADFDKGADHLAGAEPIVGVEDE